MKPRAPLTLLTTLALPLAVQAAAAPHIDACALLAPAQIAQVIGEAVEPGVRHDAGMESNGAWSSSCVWMLAADQTQANPRAPFGGRRFVMLNAMQWPAGSGRAHEFLDSFRDAAASGVLSQQPTARAFGDAALWWGDGLAVARRDTSFGLSVHLQRSSPTRSGKWEEGLAPLVLNQLDRRDAAPGRHKNL